MRELLHAGHDHDASDGDDSDSVGLILLKVGSMVLTFSLTIGFAFLPFRLRKMSFNQEKFLSTANCLSGGIFLGFSFVHMLPDAVKEFANQVGSVADLQIAYFICLLGFFSVLLVEKIVYAKVLERDSRLQRVEGNESNKPEEIEQKCEDDCCGETNSNTTVLKEINESSDSPRDPTHGHHTHDHHHGLHSHHVPFKTNSEVTPLILTATLCFHSIFEGLALGLQTSMRNLGIFLVGVALHKCAEAFGMGVSFVKSDTPKRKWIIMLLSFATVIPVGIIIGLLLTELSTVSVYISSVLGAYAAGALMYVGVGVIVEEFSGNDDLWRKFGSTMLGFVGMCCIMSISYFA